MAVLDLQSDTYRTERRRVLEAERALRNQREEVARLRQALPPGPALSTGYVFREAQPELGATVRLADLFAAESSNLFVYHMMFGPDWDEGCPLCSMWLDGLNGAAPHITQRTAFAVIAKAAPEKIRAWAQRRGWGNLRMLSSRESTFNADLGLEGATEDEQNPGASVFTRDQDGTIRLFYTGQADLGEEDRRPYTGDPRGMDLLSPVWHVFDLLPTGRGGWYPTN